MSLKTFLFGKPSRWHEIENEWKQSVTEERERYSKKIFLVEKCIMDEIGFPAENAPKSIDEKLHRLDTMNLQISSLLDDLGTVEDRLFFDMLDKRKRDEIDSASLLRRIWLWMYWHV